MDIGKFAHDEAQKMVETGTAQIGMSTPQLPPKQNDNFNSDEYRQEVKARDRAAMAKLQNLLSEIKQESSKRKQSHEQYLENVQAQMNQAGIQNQETTKEAKAEIPAAVKQKRGTRESGKMKG